MISNSKQLYAGLLFVGLGLWIYVQASTYPVGTTQHMGPGYFPSRIGLLMAFTGFCAVIQRLWRRRADPLEAADIVPLAAVLVGITAFGLLIDSFGLVVATFALVGASCYSRLRRQPWEVLVIAIVLSASTALVFIYLLGLPLKVF